MKHLSGGLKGADRAAGIKAEAPDLSVITKDGADKRRSWTPEQKLQIVKEACLPSVSISAIARRYDLNANQLHTWIRQAAQSKLVAHVASDSASEGAFLQIGVIGSGANDGTQPMAPAAANMASAIIDSSVSPSSLQPTDRRGVIEIDLQNGARVRVDASVDEKALRRVLSVIKGMA
jgi:transposase